MAGAAPPNLQIRFSARMFDIMQSSPRVSHISALGSRTSAGSRPIVPYPSSRRRCGRRKVSSELFARHPEAISPPASPAYEAGPCPRDRTGRDAISERPDVKDGAGMPEGPRDAFVPCGSRLAPTREPSIHNRTRKRDCERRRLVAERDRSRLIDGHGDPPFHLIGGCARAGFRVPKPFSMGLNLCRTGTFRSAERVWHFTSLPEHQRPWPPPLGDLPSIARPGPFGPDGPVALRPKTLALLDCFPAIRGGRCQRTNCSAVSGPR